MAKVSLNDGSDVFAQWIASQQPQTLDVYLCKDSGLLRQRDELLSKIDQARVEADDTVVNFTGELSLTDAPAETPAAVLKRLESELGELEERIRDASDAIETRCPSEDELVEIEHLREEDMNAWFLHVVALSLGRSVDDAKQLRGALPRGTWNFVCLQLLAEHVERNTSVDFLSKG